MKLSDKHYWIYDFAPTQTHLDIYVTNKHKELIRCSVLTNDYKVIIINDLKVDIIKSLSGRSILQWSTGHHFNDLLSPFYEPMLSNLSSQFINFI